jgi:hypothetical protein
MPIYGYARVSTLDQDLTLQKIALRAAGCSRRDGRAQLQVLFKFVGILLIRHLGSRLPDCDILRIQAVQAKQGEPVAAQRTLEVVARWQLGIE